MGAERPDVTPKSPVSEAFDSIDFSLDGLGEVIARIEKVLEPIMSRTETASQGVGHGPTGEKPMSSQSPLAEALTRKANTISELTAKLSRITNKIEL